MQWIRIADDAMVFLSYLVLFGIMNRMMRPERRSIWILGAAVYVHVFTWVVRAINMFDKWYALPMQLVLVYVVIFLLYPKEKPWRVLYTVAALSISNIVAVVISSVIVSMISGQPVLEMGGAEDLEMLLSHALEVSMIIPLFYAAMLPTNQRSMHGLNWMGYLLFITSQVILLFVSLILVSNDPERRMTQLYVLGVCSVLCVAADVALWRTIQRNIRAVQVEGENEALRELQQMQMRHTLELEEQLHRTASMRHDMINHLNALNILLETDNDSAKKYISELIAGVPKTSETVLCENAALNAVLYVKTLRATDIGAALDIELHLPATLAFDDVDLVSVVANLLDNALEAVAKLPGDPPPVIRLEIVQSAGFLVIRCENPCEGNVQFDGALPMTTKGEGRGGVGARTIAHIAEKYRGEARFEAAQSVFRASVALLIEAVPST